MAHVFRHKQTSKLYTIEQLKTDLRFLDAGSRTGIYATPYRCKGKNINHTRQQFRDFDIEYFNPDKFVSDNFEAIAEIY